MLLPRLPPSRSKRVLHLRLQGFIALSCQQDHRLGDHSRTHLRIFTAKTYIETKLHVPISQMGLVFPTKFGIRLCFKIIFQLRKNFGNTRMSL